MKKKRRGKNREREEFRVNTKTRDERYRRFEESVKKLVEIDERRKRKKNGRANRSSKSRQKETIVPADPKRVKIRRKDKRSARIVCLFASCLSVRPSVCPLSLSVRMSVCMYVCLSVCACICIRVCVNARAHAREGECERVCERARMYVE